MRGEDDNFVMFPISPRCPKGKDRIEENTDN